MQKYWPKANADPLKTLLTSNATKKPLKYEKRPEDIKRLETNRSNKDVHICECPPISNSLTKNGHNFTKRNGLNG